MRMFQRGLRFNHSRFYTDSPDIVSNEVYEHLIEKIESQASIAQAPRDGKYPHFEEDNPCSVPACFSEVLHCAADEVIAFFITPFTKCLNGFKIF